jgi:hypothetical protein
MIIYTLIINEEVCNLKQKRARLRSFRVLQTLDRERWGHVYTNDNIDKQLLYITCQKTSREFQSFGLHFVHEHVPSSLKTFRERHILVDPIQIAVPRSVLIEASSCAPRLPLLLHILLTTSPPIRYVRATAQRSVRRVLQRIASNEDSTSSFDIAG